MLFFVGNRIANMRVSHANQRHNVASKSFVKFFTIQAAIAKNFLNSCRARDFAIFHQTDLQATLNRSASNSPNRVFSLKCVVLQAGNKQLKRAIFCHVWRWNVVNNRVKNWRQIRIFVCVCRNFFPWFSVASDCVINWILQLRIVGR